MLVCLLFRQFMILPGSENRQPVYQSAIHLEIASGKVQQVTENVREVVANTLRMMVVLAKTQKEKK